MRAVTTTIFKFLKFLPFIFWYIFTYQWSSFIFWNFKVYDALQFLPLWERHIANIGQCLAKSCPNLTRLSSVGGGSNDFPLTWVADMKSAKNHSLFAPGNTGASLQRGGREGEGQRGGPQKYVSAPSCAPCGRREWLQHLKRSNKFFPTFFPCQ